MRGTRLGKEAILIWVTPFLFYSCLLYSQKEQFH